MAGRKILIVGPSWVGDMVMAQCLFKVLRQQDPAVQIDVLAPAWSAPILERMPEVARAIAMPVGHGSLQWGVRKTLGRELAKEGYDQAILLPNSLKSALVPFFAKIPLRTGWHGEMRYGLLNDRRRLDKDKYPLMIERFVALAYEPGVELPESIPYPAFEVDQQALPGLLKKFKLTTERPVLALCPGAEFGPAKRWPEKHYAEVARRKIAEGWQVWIFGSGKDKPVAEAIIAEQNAPEHCQLLAGNTELAEAVDLLSVAAAVVSNDSGLMHIAAALGRPLVVLYGSTSPKFTPPLSSKVEVVQEVLDCSPCFKRECPLGHMNCLQNLEPEKVVSALARVTNAEKICAS